MTARRSRLAAHALAALAATLWSAPAAADSPDVPWFRERIAFEVGATLAGVDSEVEVSGRTIDLESDLGLADFAAVPSASLLWRFGRNRRHRLEASYFSLLRSETSATDVDLTLPNGAQVPLGARVETDVDLHVASLTYAYSFLHDARLELGLLLGLDFIFLSADVEGTLSGPATTVSDSLVGEEFGVPFPTAGVYLNWAFLDSLALFTRFQYFGVSIDEASGELYRGTARIEHRTFENLHLFAGVEAVGASVDLDAKSFQEVSLVYAGPRLGLVLRF